MKGPCDEHPITDWGVTLSEREVRVIARVLEPDKYPLPGEDFTDIINEALAAVRRMMESLA